MKILIVNNEKDPKDCGWLPRLKQALAEITPVEFIIEHYSEVSVELVKRYEVDAVILSGRVNSNWAEDEFPLFAGELALIKYCPVPLLGICAGHQLIGMAYGAKIDYISKDHKEKEEGYVSMQLVGEDKLFSGLANRFIAKQQHYWEIKDLPENFNLLATTKTTRIQCIKQVGRDLYGVQFHPEWFTEEYADGKLILTNFMKMAANAKL